MIIILYIIYLYYFIYLFNSNFKSKNEISSASQDFYINVLSTNCWPLHPPSSPFIIPPEVCFYYINIFVVIYLKIY